MKRGPKGEPDPQGGQIRGCMAGLGRARGNVAQAVERAPRSQGPCVGGGVGTGTPPPTQGRPEQSSDSGFCAPSLQLRVCHGAATKAALPLPRMAHQVGDAAKPPLDPSSKETISPKQHLGGARLAECQVPRRKKGEGGVSRRKAAARQDPPAGPARELQNQPSALQEACLPEPRSRTCRPEENHL